MIMLILVLTNIFELFAFKWQFGSFFARRIGCRVHMSPHQTDNAGRTAQYALPQ
jgi:hypothetical protein